MNRSSLLRCLGFLVLAAGTAMAGSTNGPDPMPELALTLSIPSSSGYPTILSESTAGAPPSLEKIGANSYKIVNLPESLTFIVELDGSATEQGFELVVTGGADGPDPVPTLAISLRDGAVTTTTVLDEVGDSASCQGCDALTLLGGGGEDDGNPWPTLGGGGENDVDPWPTLGLGGGGANDTEPWPN